MSVNEEIYNQTVIHSHYVYYYRTQLVSEIISLFNQYQTEIRNTIITFNATEVTYQTKVALRKVLNDIRERRLSDIHWYLREQLKQFAVEELDFFYRQLRNVASENNLRNRIKKPENIEKSINKNVEFEDGKIYTLLGLLRDVRHRNELETNMLINRGYRNNSSVSDVSDNLDTSFRINRTQYELIISTMIPFLTANAAFSLYTNNKRFISGYQWSSVMDEKTSDTCSYLNTLVWYYDAPHLSTLPGEIYPPGHFRCRSSVLPIVRSAEELGIVSEYFTGQPIQEFDYEKWFISQSSTVQREILGPTRYKMFAENKVKINKFFTNDGVRLTLSELKQKNLKIPLLDRSR